jgi:CheY-like chemotaxis protein
MADVLVVDDDQAIRGLLRSVLRRDGHAVDEAVDGVEALEKLQGRAYGAVLLDLMMPRMNGWEVLDRLREDEPSRLGCVIVISAALPKKSLPAEQEAAVYAMVAKPFDLADLRALVERCLAGEPKG